MKTILIENNSKGQVAYGSLLVEPKKLGVLCSDLSLQIINELVKAPACAMDVARNIGEHEQKIYYHLRRLEAVGIVKLINTEKRYGMNAKIYDVVSPVVATKLYNDGQQITVPAKAEPEKSTILSPFIENWKLNAKIILGSPYPHGPHEATARDGIHMTEFGIFLGNFITNFDPSMPVYKIDTQATKEDLESNNLILVGGPKTNTITEKVNKQLPLYFDEADNWTIVSTKTKKRYSYDHDAVIIKTKSPFNKDKQMLVIAGRRSDGLRSAILALINHTDKIMEEKLEDGTIARVVTGFDKSADGMIDSVKILE